jgi:hypothetical protein
LLVGGAADLEGKVFEFEHGGGLWS